MSSLLDRYAGSIEILKVAGDGEAFFSPDLQEVIRGAHRFPRLRKIDVLSNGLLLSEKKVEALAPGSELIRSVNISVDAGDADTYLKVRGGDWARLL